jgi:hypothetical protein
MCCETKINVTIVSLYKPEILSLFLAMGRRNSGPYARKSWAVISKFRKLEADKVNKKYWKLFGYDPTIWKIEQVSDKKEPLKERALIGSWSTRLLEADRIIRRNRKLFGYILTTCRTGQVSDKKEPPKEGALLRNRRVMLRMGKYASDKKWWFLGITLDHGGNPIGISRGKSRVSIGKIERLTKTSVPGTWLPKIWRKGGSVRTPARRRTRGPLRAFVNKRKNGHDC